MFGCPKNRFYYLGCVFLLAWALNAAEVSRAKPMFGTVFSIRAVAQNEPEALRFIQDTFDLLERFDHMASTYRMDSEIQKLHQKAGSGEFTKVSKELWHFLVLCTQVYAHTQGVIDVTVGPMVHLYGLEETPSDAIQPISLDQEKLVQTRVGLEKMFFKAQTREVYLSVPGMRFDFGALGKGAVLDHIQEKIDFKQLSEVEINFGGQLLYAARDRSKWPVLVLSQGHQKKVTLAPGSVSTSSMHNKQVKVEGKSVGHIYNPKTKQFLSGAHQVTVYHPKAVWADVWSTAIYILGYTKGKELLKKHHPQAQVWLSP